EVPTIQDADYFKKAFNAIQEAILAGQVAAGHDIGSGGLVTTLLEMTFADVNLGANYDLSGLGEADTIKALFNENIAVVLQAKDDTALEATLANAGVEAIKIGTAIDGTAVSFKNNTDEFTFDVAETRDIWYKTSFLLDTKQSKNGMAQERYANYKNQPLQYVFPSHFDGSLPLRSSRTLGAAEMSTRPKAAIIREKGSNSER